MILHLLLLSVEWPWAAVLPPSATRVPKGGCAKPQTLVPSSLPASYREAEQCWLAAAEEAAAATPLRILQAKAALRMAGAARSCSFGQNNESLQYDWNSLFDKTYVINLQRREDRRSHMHRTLNASHATYTDVIFHPAIDKSAFNASLPSRWVYPTRPSSHNKGIATKVLEEVRDWRTDENLWPPDWTEVNELYRRLKGGKGPTDAECRFADDLFPSAICNLFVFHKWEGVAACFSSHAQVLSAAQAADHDVFLVLEDDIILADHFHERLFAALASLPPDWEFLSIGWSMRHPPCVEEPLKACGGFKPICRGRGNMQNLAGYVVHRRALTWFIPMMDGPLQEKGDPSQQGGLSKMQPADISVQGYLRAHPKIKAYATIPTPLVTQIYEGQARNKGSGNSDIGTMRQLGLKCLMPTASEVHKQCANRGASRE